MLSVEDKINRFSNTIINKAAKEKKEIVSRAEKNRDKVLKEKELEYLQKAYDTIQNGIRKFNNEKNEMISKAIMDGKRKLLNRREEISKEVFDMACEKLKAFQQTKEYEDYLVSLITDNLEAIGQGDVEIIVSKDDERLLPMLNEKFNNKVSLNKAEENMIGGCILMNHTKNKYINYSLYERLMTLKEEFIQRSNIHIQ